MVPRFTNTPLSLPTNGKPQGKLEKKICPRQYPIGEREKAYSGEFDEEFQELRVD